MVSRTQKILGRCARIARQLLALQRDGSKVAVSAVTSLPFLLIILVCIIVDHVEEPELVDTL